MLEKLQFYIDGKWVDPVEPSQLDVVNPATEEVYGRISLGSAADVDAAVNAASRAFESFSQTTREERIALLQSILDEFNKRYDDVAEAIMDEMGAPWGLAKDAKAASGVQHIGTALEALKTYKFEERSGTTLIVKEPIGVCGLITPWNWPINQIAVKVAPALAAGCTMILKPSEIAPFDAIVFAEILDAAGVPAGVFNLVNADGPGVGTALSEHPGIAMVSFTGSTRAGILVAQNAAPTVKRVAQELGGKSANILLEDADFDKAVKKGAAECFENTGQSCDAPTRMLVPRDRMDEAATIAAAVADATVVGDPRGEGNKGFYVKPTVFADVSTDMTVANEEIFGPVLSILAYEDEDDAVRIANDTPYGLSGYVSSSNLERARKVAARLRTGMVHINSAWCDAKAPFGGYKQSGNGREWGAHGIDEFLEVKSIYGYEARKK